MGLAWVLLAGLTAAEGDVKFYEGSWESALKEAAKGSKLIFADFYTDWCGWCKVLDRETFPDKEVQAIFSKSYFPVKVNAEKGEGPGIAEKYEVTGFPTMVVIDPKGEELDRIIGFRPPKEMVKTLKSIAEGKSFAALKRKVVEKPSDFESTMALGQKYEEREDIDKAEELFQRVKSAKDAPAELRAKAQSRMVLIKYFKSQSSDVAAIEEYFEKNLESKELTDHARILFMQYMEQEAPPAKLTKPADYLLQSGVGEDPQFLNAYAWYLATHDHQVEKALDLAKKAFALKPKNASYADTLAEAYHRSGMHKEAVETQTKAVELAQESEQDELKERLKKFQEALEKSAPKNKKETP